jgi:thioredoxin reductase
MTDNGSESAEAADVLVVGGGVAGLCAALYTARAGLDTLVVDGGDSILRRNAHLENVPGFPAGVNSNTFLDLLTDQAERNGVRRRGGRVVDVRGAVGGFDVALEDGDDERAARVVAASWSDASYLGGLGVATRQAGTKRFVETDDCGRTNVDGVYAAGRLAEVEHQTVVVAGHGATVGIAVVRDADVPFYHDWVVPAGYFTDRGRDVPPGCAEIPAAERAEREAESLREMRARFAEPSPEPQRTHPSLEDE